MLKKVVSVHQVSASQGHRGWEGRSVGPEGRDRQPWGRRPCEGLSRVHARQGRGCPTVRLSGTSQKGLGSGQTALKEPCICPPTQLTEKSRAVEGSEGMKSPVGLPITLKGGPGHVGPAQVHGGL